MSLPAWKKLFAPADEREEVLRTPAGKVWSVRYGRAGKMPLVVVHGGPGFPHDYLLPLKDACEGRPIVFYDQFGCGRSPGSAPDGGWSAEYFVDELRVVLEKHAPHGAHVLGHSWGALVAAEAALAGSPMRSIILASPFLSARRWESDAQTRLDSLSPEVRADLKTPEDSPEYLRGVREYYRRFVHGSHRFEELVEAAARGFGRDTYETLWGPNEFVVRGPLKTYEIGARLAGLTQPVLYTAGRNDEVLPETLAEFVRETPRAEMKIFELSAHHPQLSEPREFCAAIRDFMERAEQGNG